MKFNSQVCTTFRQSERLIKMGIKYETADCYYYAIQSCNGNDYENTGEICLKIICDAESREHFEYLINVFGNEIGEKDVPYVIPAWSLDRLLELYKSVGDTSEWKLEDVTYHHIIQCISLAIKHGGFNEDFLVKNV